jgi:allophanate hydrolase
MQRDPLPPHAAALPAALDVAALGAAYGAGTTTPTAVAAEVLRRCNAQSANPIWINRVADDALLARAAQLEAEPHARTLPLYGIPFAVKDNIDAAGLPTTAACTAYAYLPERSSAAVQRLLDAGAMLVGKTNLDQFATGLVGTRSPYGEVRNAFDPAYVSGGSSSGSAVAVALGLVSFALGTDTAGSGRIPAAFNNIVGFKPTRGLVSTTGVVPACRTLDCVSVFALSAGDAQTVFDVVDAYDPADAYARTDRSPRAPAGRRLRIGVPRVEALEFYGDGAARDAYLEAVARLAALGADTVEVDQAPFLEAAEMLYGGPWIAERHAAVRSLFDTRRETLLPVIRRVLAEAVRHSATDAFQAMYRLAELRRATDPVWDACDALLLPTAPTIYTRAELAADPLGPNARLGRYTNFVNLLDLAAIALPAAFRSDGLPFGITFVAPAGTDRWLCELGARWQQACPLPFGATGELRATAVPAPRPLAAGEVTVAVVGAHLSGQPLNGELTGRGARLLRTCRTGAAYRLYALPGTTPPKPGLVRTGDGQPIEVEIWALRASAFGAFVAAVPAPLCIGTVVLEDGTRAQGFLCEAIAVTGADDITHHGGWRAYLAGLTP